MSRTILAAVFLLAVWLEPAVLTEPVRTVAFGYGLLIAYLCWTCLVTMIAWRSWWWEFRLAKLVHAVDILVFIAAIVVTETGNTDFGSPFIAYTAFLLVTGAIRWGWNGVVATACALVTAYTLSGAAVQLAGITIDLYRFERRLAYMVALSILFVWINGDRWMVRPAAMPEPPGIPGNRSLPMIAGALAFTRQSLHMHSAAIAVIRAEEPWVDLYRDSDGHFTHDRLGPDAVADGHNAAHRAASGHNAALFDTTRQRLIVAHVDDRRQSIAGPCAYALARVCHTDQGMIAEFGSAHGTGQLLVWDGKDQSSDDLPVLGALARAIGLALDREEMAQLAQSVAVAGERTALARDLHDSMAQLLAGTQFRLEALRRWIREGHDAEPEILAMKEALRIEQGHLRATIERLRRGAEPERDTDLVGELETLLTEAGHHWHVATAIDSSARPLQVPIGLAHELRLLVREAIANAARHGRCTRVELHLNQASESMLQMTINDNGQGMPAMTPPLRPRSISERVEALGGQLQIASDGHGVELAIVVPLGIAA